MTMQDLDQTGIGLSWWDSLPTIDDDDETPDGRPLAESAVSRTRRGFLKGLAVVGGALSMGVMEGIGGIRLRRAGAVVGDEYYSCAGEDEAPWGEGYRDDTLVCVGGPYSYIYCGSDGWFKDESTSVTRYWAVKACGYAFPTKRNAWRWPHGSYRYRCCDGQFQYKRNGVWRGPYFRICSQWIGYA